MEEKAHDTAKTTRWSRSRASVISSSSSKGQNDNSTAQKPLPRSWRTWRHSKTRLGRLIAIIFGGETMLLFIAGALLTILRDAHFKADDPAMRSKGEDLGSPLPIYRDTPYLYILFWNLVVSAAVAAVWALPKTKRHLPPLVYGGMLLHQEQVRAGPTHRKLILAAKVAVLALTAGALWHVLAMPATHRANLARDFRYAHVPDGGGGGDAWRWTIVGYALVPCDVAGVAWGYAAAPLLAGVLVMDFLLCFAWSPVPDMFTIAELRAMAAAPAAEAAEEGRGRGLGAGRIGVEEEAVDLACPSTVWRVRDKLAEVGEGMAGFAGRRC